VYGYSLNSLVSLSSGVQPPHWAPPSLWTSTATKITAVQPFTNKRKSEATRSLASAMLSREPQVPRNPVCAFVVAGGRLSSLRCITSSSSRVAPRSLTWVSLLPVPGQRSLYRVRRDRELQIYPTALEVLPHFRTDVSDNDGAAACFTSNKGGSSPSTTFLCGSRRCTPTQEDSALIRATWSTFISPIQLRSNTTRSSGDEHRIGAASEILSRDATLCAHELEVCTISRTSDQQNNR